MTTTRFLRGRFLHQRGGGAGGQPPFNLAPLLDVLFLLLIFLLVAAHFDRRQVVSVDLPSTRHADAAPPLEPALERVITLHSDGTLELDGQTLTEEELRELLEALPPEERLLPMIIEGDRAASLGAGLELLALLQEGGFGSCSFRVQRPEEAPHPPR